MESEIELASACASFVANFGRIGPFIRDHAQLELRRPTSKQLAAAASFISECGTETEELILGTHPRFLQIMPDVI